MDLDRIEKLIHLFGTSQVRELIVEADGWSLSVQRGAAPVATAIAGPPLSDLAEEPFEPLPDAPATAAITAPMVGVFRQGIAPLLLGSTIQAGEPVGGIESMKIMNPVISEVSGQIRELLIEDGTPVEYGQILFLVEPRPGVLEEEGDR